MSFTATDLCALALILWGLFHWLAIFAKTRAILALLAVVGIGGFLGRFLTGFATWLERLTGTITGWALGVSIPAALFVVLAILLVHDLWPGGRGASGRTSWVALAVGVLLVAGVEGFPALAPVASWLRAIPSDILNAF